MSNITFIGEISRYKNKISYKSVSVEGILYKLSDTVQLNSGGDGINWYGILEKIYSELLPPNDIQRIIKIRWFYRWSDLEEGDGPDYPAGPHSKTELFYSLHLDCNPVESLMGIKKIKFIRYGADPPVNSLFVRCIYDNEKKNFYRIQKKSLDLPKVKKNQEIYTALLLLLNYSRQRDDSEEESDLDVDLSASSSSEEENKSIIEINPHKKRLWSQMENNSENETKKKQKIDYNTEKDYSNRKEEATKMFSTFDQLKKSLPAPPKDIINNSNNNNKKREKRKRQKDKREKEQKEKRDKEQEKKEKEKKEKEQREKDREREREREKEKELQEKRDKERRERERRDKTRDKDREREREKEKQPEKKKIPFKHPIDFTPGIFKNPNPIPLPPKKPLINDTYINNKKDRDNNKDKKESFIVEKSNAKSISLETKKASVTDSEFRKILNDSFEKYLDPSIPWSSQTAQDRKDAVNYVADLSNYPLKVITHKFQNLLGSTKIKPPSKPRIINTPIKDANLWTPIVSQNTPSIPSSTPHKQPLCNTPRDDRRSSSTNNNDQSKSGTLNTTSYSGGSILKNYTPPPSSSSSSTSSSSSSYSWNKTSNDKINNNNAGGGGGGGRSSLHNYSAPRRSYETLTPETPTTSTTIVTSDNSHWVDSSKKIDWSKISENKTNIHSSPPISNSIFSSPPSSVLLSQTSSWNQPISAFSTPPSTYTTSSLTPSQLLSQSSSQSSSQIKSTANAWGNSGLGSKDWNSPSSSSSSSGWGAKVDPRLAAKSVADPRLLSKTQENINNNSVNDPRLKRDDNINNNNNNNQNIPSTNSPKPITDPRLARLNNNNNNNNNPIANTNTNANSSNSNNNVDTNKSSSSYADAWAKPKDNSAWKETENTAKVGWLPLPTPSSSSSSSSTSSSGWGAKVDPRSSSSISSHSSRDSTKSSTKIDPRQPLPSSYYPPSSSSSPLSSSRDPPPFSSYKGNENELRRSGDSYRNSPTRVNSYNSPTRVPPSYNPRYDDRNVDYYNTAYKRDIVRDNREYGYSYDGPYDRNYEEYFERNYQRDYGSKYDTKDNRRYDYDRPRLYSPQPSSSSLKLNNSSDRNSSERISSDRNSNDRDSFPKKPSIIAKIEKELPNNINNLNNKKVVYPIGVDKKIPVEKKEEIKKNNENDIKTRETKQIEIVPGIRLTLPAIEKKSNEPDLKKIINTTPNPIKAAQELYNATKESNRTIPGLSLSNLSPQIQIPNNSSSSPLSKLSNWVSFESTANSANSWGVFPSNNNNNNNINNNNENINSSNNNSNDKKIEEIANYNNLNNNDNNKLNNEKSEIININEDEDLDLNTSYNYLTPSPVDNNKIIIEDVDDDYKYVEIEEVNMIDSSSSDNHSLNNSLNDITSPTLINLDQLSQIHHNTLNIKTQSEESDSDSVKTESDEEENRPPIYTSHLSIRDLQQITLTRRELIIYSSITSFARKVVGLWVRIPIKKGTTGNIYQIAKITAVLDDLNLLYTSKNTTSKVLILELPGVKQREKFTFPYISNQPIKLEEFKRWEKKIKIDDHILSTYDGSYESVLKQKKELEKKKLLPL